MTDQIKPGDLVVVAKPTPCCGNGGKLGHVFTVAEISSGALICSNCLSISDGTIASKIKGRGGPLTSMLKKLNPPADEESRETTKELEVV